MAGSDSHDAEITEPSDTQLFAAEYKDGQLQIVEVTPFDKGDGEGLPSEGADMPPLEAEGEATKYVQVVEGDKSMMQLDLLNLTLVRCEDGVESYRLVSQEGDSGGEATVTCVLHSSDNEEAEGGASYVMVDGSRGPLVFLQPAAAHPSAELESHHAPPAPRRTQDNAQPPKLTPAEILEKAKALQKAKQQIMQSQPTSTTKAKRGRKRKSDLPPPHELLASPNFKLFLYACKLCSFKCNAIKEMTAHKAAEHAVGGGNGKWRRVPGASLQCAVCPHRAAGHEQLMRHIQDIHSERPKHKVILNSAEVEAADVLVCGACGFESASRHVFREHIERVHGATAC